MADLLEGMSPELISAMHTAFEESNTGEEFVNRIMVGDCPECGSSKTGDCDKDPEIEDPCIGRCFDCGQIWCLDCGEYFKNPAQAIKHDCPAWEDMDFDEDEWDELD